MVFEGNLTLAPLRHETFRLVWAASLASNLGALIQIVGAAWLMTAIADTPDMISLVHAAAALPILLFSLASGAIADSFDRRTVMLGAQFAMIFASTVLTAFAYMESVTPWLLLGFTFAIGCGTALHNPSWQASVGDMVPKADLPAAVSLNATANNLARSAGPAIGGAIVATLGVPVAFAVNSLSYIALIIVLLRWKPSAKATSFPREPLMSVIGGGIRYMLMSPNLGKILLRSCIFGFAATAVLALLPVVAKDVLEGGALLYGILFGAFGIGAVGGGLISGVLRRRFRPEWSIRYSFSTFAACAAVTSISSNVWVTAVGLMIGGASWVATFSLLNISVQLSTPRWVAGRALSFYHMSIFGGMAVGSWFWGMVAKDTTPQIALGCGAATMMVGAVIGIGRLGIPNQMELNVDPLNHWREPKIEFDLNPMSGPVRITIEYVIAEGDVHEFLRMMAERRRIRKRDGAKLWSLTQDAEKLAHWIETYQLSTWLGFLRHGQRLTHADDNIIKNIRRLHCGEEPPRRRCFIERPTRAQTTAIPQSGAVDLH